MLQLPVLFSEEKPKTSEIKIEAKALTTGIHLPEVTLLPGATIHFDLDLRLASGLHGNEEAPNGWRLSAGGECEG